MTGWMVFSAVFLSLTVLWVLAFLSFKTWLSETKVKEAHILKLQTQIDSLNQKILDLDEKATALLTKTSNVALAMGFRGTQK